MSRGIHYVWNEINLLFQGEPKDVVPWIKEHVHPDSRLVEVEIEDGVHISAKDYLEESERLQKLREWGREMDIRDLVLQAMRAAQKIKGHKALHPKADEVTEKIKKLFEED